MRALLVAAAVVPAVIAVAGCTAHESERGSEGEPTVAAQILAQHQAVQPRHDSLVLRGPFEVAVDRSLFLSYATRSDASPHREGQRPPPSGCSLSRQTGRSAYGPWRSGTGDLQPGP